MVPSTDGCSGRGRVWSSLLALLALGACSPTLDWRENRAAGAGLVSSFPCRPDHHVRTVAVAGHSVQMEMQVCAAGGATYAVSFFDVGSPAETSPALRALRAALIGNVQTAGHNLPSMRAVAINVNGMTPSPDAGRWQVRGHRPDGTALSADGAFFVHGLRIYQAAVVGSALVEDAVEPFFDGLKFPG